MSILKIFKTKENKKQQSFQLSNLIDILQDGICITNLNGELIYLNKAAYSMLGVERSADLSTINFFKTFISESEQVSYLKQQIYQKGLVRNYELELQRIGDGIVDVILTLNIIGDFRQQTIGLLFLLKDVTELKKIQHQLLQSQKLESIGLMASGIAHDFNNILAAIIPNAELIKYSLDKSDENYKRAEIIEKSAQRASDIASRLLTFTRHKEQKFESLLNLNQIVIDSLELLEHSIPDNIKIHSQLDPHLFQIRGDDTQIQQIIMNLIINACDAMPNGGTILVKTENFKIENIYQIGSLDPGNYVKLTIKDSGVGIPMEILPKIFDPFFTTKEIGKGTGLGLSMVYGIVKSLKGHIDVSSKLNQGTQFEIYIPADVKPQKTFEDKKDAEITPNNLHLLIVDDEDYVLNILGDILEFLGYKVTKVGSGREAVAFFKKYHSEIDYVIVDLKMPKMDGRVTSAVLRKIDPNVKRIYTSGFDDSPISEEDMKGVKGFLKKPYSINQVSKSLGEILAK